MNKTLNLPCYEDVKMFSNYILYGTSKERCCLRISNTPRFTKGITIYKLYYEGDEETSIDYIFHQELTENNWEQACKIAQIIMEGYNGIRNN